MEGLYRFVGGLALGTVLVIVFLFGVPLMVFAVLWLKRKVGKTV